MRHQRSTVRALRSWRAGGAGLVSLALSIVLLAAGTAAAQLPQTRLYAIFPLGAKAGATIDLKITSGADLDELQAISFNHPGIKSAQKMQGPAGKQTPVTNTFVVTIAGNVPPGLYEVRASGLFGMSNPRTFVVGDRDQINETEANNTLEKAQEIQLNLVIDAAIGGAKDVDFFRFNGKKGQRIIASCRASRIDSRLKGTLEMYDANGRRLAYGRNNIRRDPLIDVTLPADGQYFVKLYDFLYRGGADYGYRLLIGTGPHIDYVMPPAGLPGTTEKFTLFGRNLPGGTDAGVSLEGRPLQKLDVSITLPKEPDTLLTVDHLSPVEASVDAISYTLKSPVGSSNPVLIYLATAPVVVEKEPNDEPAQSQKLTVPAEIGGQFQSVGDIDRFTFDSKAGEIYYIEVFGQRNGISADPYLILEQVKTSKEGKETATRITALDDNGANLAPNVFDTLTDDPIYRFQVKTDGTYRVTLRDRYFEVRGEPNLVYRLSIRKEQPDFRIVALATPPSANNNLVAGTWSVALRKGDNVKVDILAFRRDGFTGTIDVSVEGLPKGVVCQGGSLGAKQNRIPIVLTAAEDAPEWSGPIRVVAKSRIENPETKRGIAAALAVLKAAPAPLPKLVQDVTKTTETLNKANQALALAKSAAKAKPADKGLQDKAAAAQKASDAAAVAANNANVSKIAADKAVADANAGLKIAEAAHQAASKTVTRVARVGTIAWTGAPIAGGVARIARTLGLSVLKEKAPYQLSTDVFRVEANQGRQILIPIKLSKRNGFDNNVALTFVGLPGSTNIQIANKPIPKGKNEVLLRVFLNNNAVVGTYSLFLRSQGQVPYKRNAALEVRTKAEQAEAAKVLKTAQEDAKKLVIVRDAANKKATADVQKLKKAQDAAQAAEKKAADAQAAAKKAADELAAAKKVLADAEKTAKASTEAKTKAEAAVKQGDAKAKASDAAKKAADKRATAAANAAKPKNTNVFFPSTPIVITVKPGPATLAAAVPGGGALKKGQKLDVKVTVKRINGFQGPVTLTLPVVPGVKGVTAAPVTIAADKTEGILSIVAAADATEGQLANLVVQATMEFNGKAAVDVPITVKVSK